MGADELSLLQRLGVALVIGLLIGVERGWHQRELAEGSRVAGIRTFALIGLLGGVLAALSDVMGEGLLAVGFAATTGLIVVAHFIRSRQVKDVGMTTEVAELLTLVLGMVAVRVSMPVGAAGAVVVVALLSAKEPLHHWLGRLQELELVAAIKLLLISVVLLPVLPDEGFGPGGVLNPYKLWLLVVMIAGLSFVGYFAIKLAGPRLGSLLTGIFGGLASSTALTVSFARMGRTTPALQPTLAAGVAVAAATMLIRLLLIVGVVRGSLVESLAWPIGAMAAAGYLGALLLWLRSGGRGLKPGAEMPMQNPFEMGMALKFATILAAVFVLAELAKRWLGDSGLYVLAAVSGLADVDAISVSVANMAGISVAAEVAAGAIVIAAVANTAVKAAIVWSLCGGVMAKGIGAVAAVMTATAGMVWLAEP